MVNILYEIERPTIVFLLDYSNGTFISESQREVVFRNKLSDSSLADGNGQAVLSDHVDVESIHSEASSRQLTPRLEQQPVTLNDKIKVSAL